MEGDINAIPAPIMSNVAEVPQVIPEQNVMPQNAVAPQPSFIDTVNWAEVALYSGLLFFCLMGGWYFKNKVKQDAEFSKNQKEISDILRQDIDAITDIVLPQEHTSNLN